jgi:hypothetical protein
MMKIFETVLVTLMVLYQYYAVPAGIVFAFLLTRHLIRSNSSAVAVGITLAWALMIFTPLIIPMQSFFPEFYSPWYLTFLASPPTPQFSLGALVITATVSLITSWFAVIVRRK